MSVLSSVNEEHEALFSRDYLLEERRDEGDEGEDRLSPSVTDASTRAMRSLNLSTSPRLRNRSSSMKKSKIPASEDFELEEMRPRTCSLPTRNTYKKPNLLTIRMAGAGPCGDYNENEFYRQRHFETTPRGGLINRGDSIISRSTNSVVSSSESELGALSRTSSFMSQASLGNEVLQKPYNVAILGSNDVGKTALTQQFMTSEYLGGFDTSVDGDPEKTVSVLLDGEETYLAFIEPSTQQPDFPSCECIDAFVIVYSIDDRATFDRAVDFLYSIRKEQHNGSAIILVGNKCELARTRHVSIEEAKAVATTYDCKFVETSTVLNHNVDQLLVGVVSQIRLKQKKKEIRGNLDQSYVTKSKHLLCKLFRKENLSKSCENLYTV